MNWKKLKDNSKVIDTVGIIIIVLLIFLIWNGTRNKVLTRDNITYKVTGTNKHGTVDFSDSTENKLAKEISTIIGKKVGLSKSQIDTINDTDDASDIMDGTTASDAYDLSGNSKYNSFEEAIRGVRVVTYVNNNLESSGLSGINLNTGSNLKNGDKVTLKMYSDKDNYKIRSEKYKFKIRGLKKQKEYNSSEILKHVTYKFSGFNNTRLVNVKTKTDSWYKKRFPEMDPPKINDDHKLKNGQPITVNLKSWASRNSNGDYNIKVNKKLTIKVAGLTELDDTNYKDVLKKLDEFKNSKDDIDNLKYTKAYFSKEDEKNEYSFNVCYKGKDSFDTTQNVTLSCRVKYKNGKFSIPDDDDITVFDTDYSPSNGDIKLAS